MKRIEVSRIIQNFPNETFQNEGYYKPILDYLFELELDEMLEHHISVQDRLYILKDKKNPTINQILGLFIEIMSSYLIFDDREISFMREFIIVVCLVRRLLNSRGYSISGKASNLKQEYCSHPENSIGIITSLTDVFVEELYPCYLSEVVK